MLNNLCCFIHTSSSSQRIVVVANEDEIQNQDVERRNEEQVHDLPEVDVPNGGDEDVAASSSELGVGPTVKYT